MTSRRMDRFLVGAVLAVSVGVAVWLLGDSLAVAAISFAFGALASALAFRPVDAPAVPRQPPSDSGNDWAEALADFIPEPLLVLEGTRVVVANAAASRLLGRGVVGKDVRLAIRHPAAVERLLEVRLPPGETERVDVTGIGEPDRRWSMSVAAHGAYRFVRLVDTSEAQAVEQMRVDFVANASHELRTPLATIIGFTETLRDDSVRADAETFSRFLSIMYDEAKRMQRLIEDLISLSRIEAERFSVPCEAVHLVSVATEAIDGCGRIASQRSTELVLEADPELPPVPGDRGQLLQLLDNLISNALRYGRAGSKVTVSIGRSAGSVRIDVSDEGEGIPPEHLHRVTERFYRVDASRSRSVGGTGLGLSIVKHIVERHRGRLEIKSDAGVGTTVTVSLPVAAEALSSKSHDSVSGLSLSGPIESANAP